MTLNGHWMASSLDTEEKRLEVVRQSDFDTYYKQVLDGQHLLHV